MGRLNILVYSSLFPNNVWPNHGVFTKNRAIQLLKTGSCRVRVVAPVPYCPPIGGNRWGDYSHVRHYEEIDGMEVCHPRYFMLPKVSMIAHGLLMFIGTVWAVRKVLQQAPCDLIDAHYVYPDGLAAVLLGKLFRKPVIVSALGSDINVFSQLPIIRKLIVYALTRADHVVSVSQALKERIVQLGIPPEKVSVIPTGVDLIKFFPSQKSESRKKLKLPDRPIILSVGNLTANKGVDLIIRALKELVSESSGRNPYLVVVGCGEMRGDLETLVKALDLQGHVHFTGAIPHDELQSWYSAADVFCLASGMEGWPNVILESMACGTPVVATAVGGVPEIICSDELGLLAQRSVHGLAMQLGKALQTHWRQERLTSHAQENSWEKAAQSLVRLFHAFPTHSASLPVQP